MRIERVLLVDDEPDIRKIAALSLNRVGRWQVIAAASGPEAIALVSKENPDVILLDVMMPGMDGEAAFRVLHEVARDVPVIFMTAKAQKNEVDRYLALGAAGVIIKPFDPMTLPEQIMRIVEGCEGSSDAP